MNPNNLLKLTKIILSLKERVKCPICLDLVENTVQLGCSHQFCNSCLQEHRSQNLPQCPVCKSPINKRCVVYKDHFADELSKFVNRACQLIKETYAHEVNELITNKDKLQAIIDTAPQDVYCVATTSKTPQSLEFKKPPVDAFDKLASLPRCYTNKKRLVQPRQKPTILNFDDDNTRTKIVNWLNDNQQTLDTFTQSPNFLTDDEGDFELPSISQVPYRKQAQGHRIRSQSLTLANNLNEPFLKRYHSLTQGLNEDDYDIEEVHSETLVKQVERKVLQVMLEDECLENMEHLAQQSKDKLKKGNATPKKVKKTPNKNKSCNIPNSGSSSGWDRIKDVKKSIKKASKEPRKLNISLQESGNTKDGTKFSPVEKAKSNDKKSGKESRKESSVTKETPKAKKSPKASTSIDNKENDNRHNKADTKTDNPNEQTSHVFNLSAVENYFEQNIEKIVVTPEKDTSSDLEIDVINSTTKKLKESTCQNKTDVINMATKKESTVQDRSSTSKGNTSAKDKSIDDEEIFFLPTQVTLQTANNTNTLCYVAPVPKEFNDIDVIAGCLTNNLQCCISSASTLNNEVAHSLVECFTNLKTYIDKIMKRKCEKKEPEVQTSQTKQASRKTIAIQTEGVNFSCVGVQTAWSPVKRLSTKNIQTSQNYIKNAEVQTDSAMGVEQGVQTEHLSTTKITREKSVEKIITHSIRYTLSPPDLAKEDVKSQNSTKVRKQKRSSTETYKAEKPEDDEEVISAKTSKSSSVGKQEQHISEDSSKPGKTKSGNLAEREPHISVDSSKPGNAKSGDIVSQESVLICTLGTTGSNKSSKKINRKLSYGDVSNRPFKRIRKPASDSESDEDGMPVKRRLVRDDLTIEFVDTQKGSKDSQAKRSTPESEKMDYDKYLLEVMAKYGTPPPRKGGEVQFNGNNSSKLSLSNGKKRDSQRSSNSLNKKTLVSQKESQKDNADHVFTAHLEFEENLEKFDKEIFEHEHTTKAHSTEYDLVENTPLLSPKAKVPRLLTSNNKKEAKDFMKEPLQILSKGSAHSSTSKRKEPIDEESLGHFTQKEPSTLNRNIENLPSQTEKCTVDVAGILEDLENDDDFFKSNMENDEKEQENELEQGKRLDVPDDEFPMDDLPDDVADSKDKNDHQEILNITQENIDQVVENLNEFDDDDLIEAELEKISFTAEQRKTREAEKHRIKILQNIKIRSQNRPVAKSPFNGVIEGSDLSDEELVETTPEKKKNNSRDQSLDNLEHLENNSLGMEFCLPPPPGFGDEVKTSPEPDDARESPTNDKDFHPLEGNKSSLTPDSLSNFIVTPDTAMHRKNLATQNDYSQLSLTFKPSAFTPNRPLKDKDALIHSTPRVSHISAPPAADTFSPITKSTVKFSQMKFTPLLSTSRLSTKRSSLMTSTPNQKSILNYVKASQDSPSSSQQKPKPCIMWSRIVNKDLNVFTQLEVKKLVTTANSFNPRVTHLIVLVDEKGQIVSHTAKILVAIAAGIWVVRYEWAQDCLKMNRIVSEEPYEALDMTGVPGPQISRLSRETKPLFRGFRFYCSPPLLIISKVDLENILQLSGGEIARNLEDLQQQDGKVNIILTESSASEDVEQFENLLQVYKAVTIDVEWLTRCIGQYKLVSFRAFLVSGDDSNICDLGYPSTLVESVPFTLTDAM